MQLMMQSLPVPYFALTGRQLFLHFQQLLPDGILCTACILTLCRPGAIQPFAASCLQTSLPADCRLHAERQLNSIEFQLIIQGAEHAAY